MTTRVITNVSSVFKSETLTHDDINNNLHQLISNFDLEMDVFSQILERNNAIISGSSMLKVLTVQDMTLNTSSDLDIYVQNSRYEEITSYLEQRGYKNFSYKTREQAHPYFRIKHINAIKKYFMPEANQFIDIIISYDPIDCIKHYDFQFLLNWYDGQSIKVVHPDSILKKTSYVNTLTEKFSQSRKHKYTRRGYAIDDSKEKRFDFRVYNWKTPPSIIITIKTTRKNLCQQLCSWFRF